MCCMSKFFCVYVTRKPEMHHRQNPDSGFREARPTLDYDFSSSLTPPSSSGRDTQKEFVKPVSSRSCLIEPATFETIPEKDESAL